MGPEFIAVTSNLVKRTENLTIRRVEADELSLVQTIAREVIITCYPAFLGPKPVAAFIESGQSDQVFIEYKSDLFVLRDENQLIGFSICFEDFIHLMMVRPDAQRGGYGSQLLGWCEEAIKDRGFGTARLETFASNAQAVRFYIKNGWSDVKRDNEISGVFARIWFEKQLN